MMMTAKSEIVEQLETLRKILLKSVMAVIILMLPSYFLTPRILDFFINNLLKNPEGGLYYFSVTEVFFVRLKIAFCYALVVAYPYIFTLIWQFLAPALKATEKSVAICWQLAVIFMGSVGVLFNLCLVIPALIRFAYSFEGAKLEPMLGVGDLIDLTLAMSLGCGVFFQLPIVVIFLAKRGVLNLTLVKKIRPYAVMIIFFLAALFSPPDIVSMMLLGVPAWVLWELSLYFSCRYLIKKVVKE